MRKSSGTMKDQAPTEHEEEASVIAEQMEELDDAGTEESVEDTPAPAATASDDRISELQRELTLERDKYLRLAAEFDNFRKRMMKERSEAEVRGQAELVKHILDPLDDIARFADLDPAVTECATVVQGVDMVEKKLDKQLRAAGLETVNPVEAAFDPNMHEAVATEPAKSADLDGTVSQVYQVGYTFKGQLLRPARVVVRQHHGSN
jgi:molecular chaperone GrpE